MASVGPKAVSEFIPLDSVIKPSFVTIGIRIRYIRLCFAKKKSGDYYLTHVCGTVADIVASVIHVCSVLVYENQPFFSGCAAPCCA